MGLGAAILQYDADHRRGILTQVKEPWSYRAFTGTGFVRNAYANLFPSIGCAARASAVSAHVGLGHLAGRNPLCNDEYNDDFGSGFRGRQSRQSPRPLSCRANAVRG